MKSEFQRLQPLDTYLGEEKALEVDRNISSGFSKHQARTWRRHWEHAGSSTRMLAGGRR